MQELVIKEVLRRRYGEEEIGEGDRNKKTHEFTFVGFLRILVGRAGFEPATNGLKVRCSTS
jgi:hypothetical protein